MDIFGPLPKTSNGTPFVLVMKDRYLKLMRAVTASMMAFAHIASMFMEFWIIQYNIQDYVLTDNGTPLITKLFELLCAFLNKTAN